MTREIIAVSSRQLGLLLLLIVSPMPVLLLVTVLELDPNPSNSILAEVVAGVLCTGLAAVVGWAMLARRAIELADDALVVKHSFYTLRISKDEARQLAIEQLQSPDNLRISIKKNGVAAFGYLSGWFYGPSGKLMFCAISRLPVFRLSLPGASRCPLVALSCSPAMAAAIYEWSRK